MVLFFSEAYRIKYHGVIEEKNYGMIWWLEINPILSLFKTIFVAYTNVT